MATRSDRSTVEVEPLSQTRGQDEIEKGKVGEALQKFQVHEDTAIAYKMQSEEFENHVSRNKEQRKSVRDGVKTAKQTYLEEVKNARILPDNSVAEIEQKQWLTDELHRRIEEQEVQARIELEKQRRKDEEVAIRVQREEEKRMRYLEHKRQQRIAKDEEEHRRLLRIMKELQEAELSDPGDDAIPSNDVIELPQNHDIIVLADGTAIDARQNQIQTEEQVRESMKRRDEELAKLLQQQEDDQIEKKRTMHEDYRKAIELQDREIAKHLQRQEKAKAERRREKHMRRVQSLPERDEVAAGQRRNLPSYHAAVDDFRREDVPPVSNGHRVSSGRQYELERRERPSEVRTSPEQPYEEVWKAKSGSNTRALTPEMLESSDSRQEPGGYFSNIAETLDPTFQRATRREDDEEDDKSGSGKSAPIVPPLKRKVSKEKTKKSRGK